MPLSGSIIRSLYITDDQWSGLTPAAREQAADAQRLLSKHGRPVTSWQRHARNSETQFVIDSENHRLAADLWKNRPDEIRRRASEEIEQLIECSDEPEKVRQTLSDRALLAIWGPPREASTD